ncbi:MAG: hypothetical protein QGH93_03605 [Gammaproteobacteria bacterium]|nr:hypothetical protein [Chromatiales bacterium]MDP6673922.1 hypothetical protein [Gammaproteobacteria bacterium]
MKILDFLRRSKGRKKAASEPIRTVHPPGSVRAENQARLAKEFEESDDLKLDDQSPDEFMDTSSLKLEGESGDLDNPYETHTWEMDREEGIRRIEDLSLVNRKQPEGTKGNPYDTIVKKKGWQ